MSLETFLGQDLYATLIACEYYIYSFVLGVCGLLIFYLVWKPKLNLPPGPTGLPLVGYFPFLGKEAFITLDALSKTYGNIFSLYLGRSYTVILGDYRAMKEALSNSATLYRPPGAFDFQPDGMGVSNSNGEKWKQDRQFVVRTMKDLGLGKSTWEQLVENEVLDLLQIIANKKGEPINLGHLLMSSMSNNVTSLIFGKRLPPGPKRDMLNSAVEAMVSAFSQLSIWSFFPWVIRILATLKIGKYYYIIRELIALNTFIRKEVEDHKKANDDTKGTHFLSIFLQAIEENKGKKKDNIFFTETNLIGNCQALFSAGSETTKTSMNWLLLAMTAYPEVQRKVHFELDSVVGKEQKASWENRLTLPYTYAVIMEAQRWRTVAPLNVARMASKDFKLCGYDIPKGATIITNLWAIHNDLRYWKKPEEFIPERFLENEGKDINFRIESYAPFSYGKRRCPGENVALIEIFLYFTAIMQQYEVRDPDGGKPNLDGILGITYLPVSQKFCFVQR